MQMHLRLVERVGALGARADINWVIGNRSSGTNTGGLRISIRTTSTNTSNAKNDTDDYTNDRSGRKSRHDGSDRGTTVAGLTARAGAIEAEEELALVLAVIGADNRNALAALEGVTKIIRAGIVIGASDVLIDTAELRVASVSGAHALIIAVVLGDRSMHATAGRITGVDSALVLVVAGRGNILPLASLGREIADVIGAGIAIVALRIVGALWLSNTRHVLHARADARSGSAGVVEARRVWLARNWSRNTSALGGITSIGRALVRGISAVLRSILAANAGERIRLAEVGSVAGVRRRALTADAKSAAATARVQILLAGTGDEIKRVLRKIAEVRVAKHALGLLIGDDEELVH